MEPQHDLVAPRPPSPAHMDPTSQPTEDENPSNEGVAGGRQAASPSQDIEEQNVEHTSRPTGKIWKSPSVSSSAKHHQNALRRTTNRYRMNKHRNLLSLANSGVKFADQSLQPSGGIKSGLPVSKQVAVMVPYNRPTQKRRGRKTSSETDTETYRESAEEVFTELNWTCFKRLGQWKRYLLFYGVTHVEEVNFNFSGYINEDGTFPIRTTPIDHGKVREEIKEILAREERLKWVPWNERCTGPGPGDMHSDECSGETELLDRPCILKQIETAHEKARKLRNLDLLTKCAQDPSKANWTEVLEGMAADSCVYSTEGYNQVRVPKRNQLFRHNGELRGLQYTLGWQKKSMAYHIPRKAAWLYLAIVLIGISVAAWAHPRADWNTAIAFGQLVTACITLVALYA